MGGKEILLFFANFKMQPYKHQATMQDKSEPKF
jgi:hypothetical protein